MKSSMIHCAEIIYSGIELLSRCTIVICVCTEDVCLTMLTFETGFTTALQQVNLSDTLGQNRTPPWRCAAVSIITLSPFSDVVCSPP